MVASLGRRKIYVIAESHSQAKRWAIRADLRDWQWQYVFDSRGLRGIPEERRKMVRVGTWFQRKDYNELMAGLAWGEWHDLSNGDAWRRYLESDPLLNGQNGVS